MLVYSALCFGVFLCETNSILAKQAAPIDGFKQCLMSSPMSLGHCLGMEVLTKLQSIDNNPEFDVVDGVSFARDEQEGRESYNFLDRDPGDVRSIMDSVGQIFSRRSLRWDMSYLYPGLQMRVSPSTSPGGVLEFVMDPQRETQHSLKEASTGQLLARQFLLPFLMGLKSKVATLIPIIFGILAVVITKGAFFSKVGLLISTVIGLGSLLFGSKYPLTGQYSPTYEGSYGYQPYRVPVEEHYYPETNYRGDTQYKEENNAVQQPYLREDKIGRNFAWDEVEKETKT